jgi:hypothetical protein
MVNIADVPFPFRSGREEDQILALQQKDAVLWISLYNLKKGFRQLEFFFGHLITSSV